MIAHKLADHSEGVFQPQVAGQFYPADPGTLGAQIRRCLVASRSSSIAKPKMLISPHAGFEFSGAVAASAYHGLSGRQDMVRRVVIIGPAHKMAFRGIAIHSARAWHTPLGDIGVDWLMQRRLSAFPEVTMDDRPFLGEHSIETQLPFLQASLKSFEIIPILVGDVSPEVVAKVLEAVWGGPETLIVVSSDLSHFLDDARAKALDNGTRQIIESCDSNSINADRACGHRVIAGALLRAKSQDLRVTGLDIRNSGEFNDARDRVVGYGAFAFEYAASAELNHSERQLLLATAARCLAHACQHDGATPKLTITGELPLTLSAIRSTFVTLEKNGNLRGCIGSLKPYRPLLVDTVANGIKAGFSDPRFPRLSSDELGMLDLSVAILSHPRDISFRNEAELLSELSPDRDGLIVQDQGKSALFLPHVWANIPDPRIFLTALKQKAGLSADYWSPTFSARRFTVEKFGRPVAELLK